MACDPGSIFVEFVWPEGRPIFPEGQPVSTFVRVEERVNIDAPGRILSIAPPHPFTERRTHLPEVPYGSNRVIIAEARESSDADAQVLYYGLSELFSISRGQHVVVPTYMEPTQPPQSTALGGNIQVVTSSSTPGVTGGAEVELVLLTDTGVEVRLSNVLGLPERASVA